MFTVSELMTREVTSLREDETLSAADRLIDTGHIRHLPVVRGQKLVGLVTHRDLLRNRFRRNPRTGREVRIGDVMVRRVTTIEPETPVLEAIQTMLSNKFGCLPVVQPDKTLVGILTESDLLRLAARKAEEIDRQHLAAEFED